MVTYSFYTDEFCGNELEGSEFEYYTKRASEVILRLTSERADLEDEASMHAVCAVAEVLCRCEGREGLIRENADGFSAEYTDFTPSLISAATTYLSPNLFYRGVMN